MALQYDNPDARCFRTACRATAFDGQKQAVFLLVFPLYVLRGSTTRKSATRSSPLAWETLLGDTVERHAFPVECVADIGNGGPGLKVKRPFFCTNQTTHHYSLRQGPAERAQSRIECHDRPQSQRLYGRHASVGSGA